LCFLRSSLALVQIALTVPAHGGHAVMLVAKPKRMSKSTDPTNGVDTYPDSSSARVNNQRRSVPVDPISKTTTPLPIGSISLSSHVTRSVALHRHRRTNREPTKNYLAPKNPVESISSRLSSASQRSIEAGSHQGVKVKSPECGEKAFAFARSGNLAQIRTCHTASGRARARALLEELPDLISSTTATCPSAMM
jgi:hypothetical protein